MGRYYKDVATELITKTMEVLEVRLKYQLIDGTDRIALFRFRMAYEIVCDSGETHQSPSMRSLFANTLNEKLFVSSFIDEY